KRRQEEVEVAEVEVEISAEGIFCTSERWPSGRRRSPAKGVYPNPVSRVRIPPSPPFQFYPPRSPIQSQTESPDFPREGFEPDKRVRPLARASGNERAARSPQARNGQKPCRLIPTGVVRWHCRRSGSFPVL